MGKKCILFSILTLFVFTVSSAFATAILFDWNIDVDGSLYQAVNIYLPPTVGGEITSVSGFTMSDPGGYGFNVPNALGSVEVTFNPGTAGTYTILSMFDVEIDEWSNTFHNENGAEVGTPTAGQSGVANNDSGDIYWYMDWDFSLGVNEFARVTYNITTGTPPSGFHLTQNDPDSNETYYLSSNLNIQSSGTSVPDAGIYLLLGTALASLVTVDLKKLLKKAT